MSPPKTEVIKRDRQMRTETTEDVAVFVGWACAKMRLRRNELAEVAYALLQERLEEFCDDVPAIDVGDYDFASLKE